VIDVPGHERFIRNMVAGAWSLDCALLLVAADDGWMQQTGDHAVVLAALGVPAVILVVTKADIAPPDRAAEVRRDALARAAAIFGREPPSIEVAAAQGRGIEELKALVVETLEAVPDRPLAFPVLYVDRVFSLKGPGMVITGSLRGAALGKDDPLVLLPQGEQLRVRGLQTYNAAAAVAEPTSRVALNIQRPRAEPRRGSLVTSPGAPFRCERQFIARLRPLAQGEEAGERPGVRNHSEVEVALGTGHELAQVHFLDDARYARVELAGPLPALWNQPFFVIRHGGSAILARGNILWFGDVPREERRRFTSLLAALPDPATEADRFSLELRYAGFSRRGGAAGPEAMTPAGAISLGEWIFDGPWLERISGEIVGLAGRAEGVSSLEIEGKLSLGSQALHEVLAHLVGSGRLERRNSLYFTPRAPGTALPPAVRKLHAAIAAAGRAGFQGSTPELNALVRLGLAVPLEGGIFYTKETYEEVRAEILAGRKPGDRFSIPEAKQRTGLSRKYMLPVLNRMEKDGLLRRDGDVRVVLQAGP
jgi:selenocysteine-specific elongation factor